MSRVRLVPILLIAVITLAVLFGGYQAYMHFNLFGPLQNNLQRIAGVKSVQIVTGSSNRVTVKLGPVDKLQDHDLQETYQAIVANIESSLGTGESIAIEDNHNSVLNNAFEQYEITLLQGVAQGNYKDAIVQVNKQAAADGITVRVTMDLHDIYIQLSKGPYYLYRVLPYTLHQGGGAS